MPGHFEVGDETLSNSDAPNDDKSAPDTTAITFIRLRRVPRPDKTSRSAETLSGGANDDLTSAGDPWRAHLPDGLVWRKSALKSAGTIEADPYTEAQSILKSISENNASSTIRELDVAALRELASTGELHAS